MIAFLEGILAEKQTARVVINVNGVGHEVFIPLSSYERLPAEGQSVKMLTYDYQREDAHHLYGFATPEEKSLFELLMQTTGIGPKIALSILSGMSVREVKAAIASGDAKRLTSISGVGRKLAERMIVELKDKIGAAEAMEAVAGAVEPAAENMKARDAVLALIALGFTQENARRMVTQATNECDLEKATVEDIVKRALRA